MDTGHFLAGVASLTETQRSMLDALSVSMCGKSCSSQEATLKF